MAIGAYGYLTIAYPDFAEPRQLIGSGIVASWELSEVGRLSCLLPARDAHRAGFADLKGKWIAYQHPMVGPWAGIIEDPPSTPETGILEISAATMERDLANRRMPLGYAPAPGHAGALALRSLNDAHAFDPLPYADVSADEDGVILGLESREDDLFTVWRGLAQQSGQDFLVDVDADSLALSLKWRIRMGVETDVLFTDRDVAGRVDDSLTTIKNDWLGIADNQEYARSARAWIEDADSIAEFGRQQGTARYVGVTSKTSILPLALADIKQFAKPLYLPTLTVSGRDVRLRDVRVGNTVIYQSRAVNRLLAFRVRSISVDATANLVTLAGDAREID